jgi:hypothetical protein
MIMAQTYINISAAIENIIGGCLYNSIEYYVLRRYIWAFYWISFYCDSWRRYEDMPFCSVSHHLEIHPEVYRTAMKIRVCCRIHKNTPYNIRHVLMAGYNTDALYPFSIAVMYNTYTV